MPTEKKSVTETPERKVAPDVGVELDEHWAESRLEMEQAYDAKSPDYKHMWTQEDTAAEVLEAKSQEVVKRADGKLERHGADILVRMPIAKWKARKTIENDRAMKRVRQFVPKEKIGRYVKAANPVQVSQPEGAG